MPYRSKKNSLCYNSRLTEVEFKYIIADYCRGITPLRSSGEFKERVGKTISRQTIAHYFEKISKCVIQERKRYPWWSIDWNDFQEEQVELVRKLVYAKDGAIAKLRSQFKETIGSEKVADNYVYVDVLRKMSKEMNGLPKNNFWHHMIRASEIALPIEQGHPNPSHATFVYIHDLFDWHGYSIFNLKNSATKRREKQDRKKSLENDLIYDWCFEGWDQTWYKLKQDNSEPAQKLRFLAAFNGELDIEKAKWTQANQSTTTELIEFIRGHQALDEEQKRAITKLFIENKKQ